MMPPEIYKPGKPDEQIADRKQRFAALNNFIRARNGWLTSVPGDPAVTMECLPDSSLPIEIAKLGYRLEALGQGQRILPSAIVERFTRGANGVLELADEGSTKPIAETRTHAGICSVQRYGFELP